MIDVAPTGAQQASIGLDITNESATNTLLEMAEGALQQLPINSRNLLDAILRRPAS